MVQQLRKTKELQGSPSMREEATEAVSFLTRIKKLRLNICFNAKVTTSCKKRTYLLDSVGEGEGGMFQENSIKTCILSRVKQITSPGWMHETSAQAWCTGKTQRDQVEEEMGVGIERGNTCKSMADSFQCMTKPTTIL